MRKAVGLNQARIGPISGMDPQSEGDMWDTAYIYKGLDRAVGYSPGRSWGSFSNYQLRFEGIHLLSGFLIQVCSTRPCPPDTVTFSVRNLTLNKYGYHDYGSQVYIRYSAGQEVSTVVYFVITFRL